MASANTRGAYQSVQQQPPPHASHASSNKQTWEGDRMLHIYLWDYFRKRGFIQAAQALVAEAGVPPDQEVPIDAPQGLIFEWWTVFWEIFTARSTETNPSLLFKSDAHVYVHSQESKMSRALQEQQHQQRIILAQRADLAPNQQFANWPPGAPNNNPLKHPVTQQLQRAPSQQQLGPQNGLSLHQNGITASAPGHPDHAAVPLRAGGVGVGAGAPMSQQSSTSYEAPRHSTSPNQPGQQSLQASGVPAPRPPSRDRDAALQQPNGMISTMTPPNSQRSPSNTGPREATSPQLALNHELSQLLGLPRPASTVVIQQCMNMMNLGNKRVEELSPEERVALSNRVKRLQTAQNDAQLRLAQLHGLQPPKAPQPSQPETVASQQQQQQAGQKRKGSPNSNLHLEHGPGGSARTDVERPNGPESRWPQPQPQNAANQGLSPLPHGSVVQHPQMNGVNGPSPSAPNRSFGQSPGSMQQPQALMHQQQQAQMRMAQQGQPTVIMRVAPNGMTNGNQSHAPGPVHVNGSHTNLMGPPPSPATGAGPPMHAANGWSQQGPSGAQGYAPQQQHYHQHQLQQQGGPMQANGLSPAGPNIGHPIQPSQSPHAIGAVKLLQQQQQQQAHASPPEFRPPSRPASVQGHSMMNGHTGLPGAHTQYKAQSQPPPTDNGADGQNGGNAAMNHSNSNHHSNHNNGASALGDLEFDFNVFLSGAPNLDSSENVAFMNQLGGIAGL